MRKAAVNFEAMGDVTKEIRLTTEVFPGLRLPRFSGKVGDKCGASQRAWRAFSFGGMQDIQIA
jgi:hypothetical protein